jgi:hypothetical protein
MRDRCGSGVGVAAHAGRPIVEIVAGMRHEKVETERFAPLKLGDE